jgi:hypothetical protein
MPTNMRYYHTHLKTFYEDDMLPSSCVRSRNIFCPPPPTLPPHRGIGAGKTAFLSERNATIVFWLLDFSGSFVVFLLNSRLGKFRMFS